MRDRQEPAGGRRTTSAMSTGLAAHPDEDTQRVRRPPRLGELDLQPPPGPVPAEVLAYFEAALTRQAERERRRSG
jgi:hypothetical protein